MCYFFQSNLCFNLTEAASGERDSAWSGSYSISLWFVVTFAPSLINNSTHCNDWLRTAHVSGVFASEIMLVDASFLFKEL